MTFIFRAAGCFCPWRNYTMMNLNKKLGEQTLPIRTMSISSSIGFPIDLVRILPALLNSESLRACKIFEMLKTIPPHLCALFCISNFGRNLFVWAGLAWPAICQFICQSWPSVVQHYLCSELLITFSNFAELSTVHLYAIQLLEYQMVWRERQI